MENSLNQNSEINEKEGKNDFKVEDNNNIEAKELNNGEKNENEKEINNNINTGNTIEENNEEPIYVMTLALEQGKSEKIEIFANSDPAKLAYDFCSKNNLDFNALDYLREQITNLLESYAKNENEDYNENENGNEDINIPEIEEVQEEFYITENYKEDLNNKKQNSLENKNEVNIKKNNNNNKENDYLYEKKMLEENSNLINNSKRRNYKIKLSLE